LSAQARRRKRGICVTAYFSRKGKPVATNYGKKKCWDHASRREGSHAGRSSGRGEFQKKGRGVHLTSIPRKRGKKKKERRKSIDSQEVGSSTKGGKGEAARATLGKGERNPAEPHYLSHVEE